MFTTGFTYSSDATELHSLEHTGNLWPVRVSAAVSPSACVLPLGDPAADTPTELLKATSRSNDLVELTVPDVEPEKWDRRD